MTWLWGSSEVRELFFEWVEDYPNSLGPRATADDRQRVLGKANKVRQRMADEVQGRVDLD